MNPDILERISALEEKLDLEFKNKLLLVQAITHRSYPNESSHHPTGHNERMEFMGDAVLELVVTEFLYKKYPEATEGELTNHRAALVQEASFAEASNSLDLLRYAFFAKGQLRDNEKVKSARDNLAACLFEAIIGAVYLDQGMGACRLLIDWLILNKTSKVIAETKDYKGLYQEFAQAKYGLTPVYKTVDSSGPGNNPVYVIACMLGEREVARASAGNKKDAQKAAAKLAYEQRSQ